MAKNLTTGLQRGLRRSIAGGLGTGDLFSIAALDLQFARHKALDSRITFTRASSGTYVGGDGLIKTATTNLLLRSEEFNDASWSSVNTNVTADAIAAPNGTLTADLLTSNTTTNNSKRRQQSLTTIANVPYTLTCYFKLANASIPHAGLSLTSGADASTYVTARWNLSTGVNTLGTANGAFTFTSQSITSIGDGWYRCSVTGIISSATDMTIVIYGSPSGTAIGSGLRGAQTVVTAVNDPIVYAWGAQLEQSSTVGEYVKTTSTINSAPRFDHNPTTGESLGLLVEESRTNLVTWSQDFSQTDWSKNASTIVSTAIASPISGVNYQKIEASTANTTVGVTSVAVSAATQQRAVSFFAKPLGNITRILVVVQGADARININLIDGTATTNATATGSTVTVSGERFTVSTPSLTNATGVRFFLKRTGESDTNTPTTIAIGEGLYLIGAQMEAGSFPTSYIPTTSATVTRSADVASITGTNFSSWYRQDEGTVFSQHTNHSSNSVVFVGSLSDGSSNNYIDICRYQPSLRALVNTSGSNAASLISALNYGTAMKTALGVAQNNFAFVANGGSILADTSGDVPVVDRVNIGTFNSGLFSMSGTIRRLTYWPQRLPNETLQTITQ